MIASVFIIAILAICKPTAAFITFIGAVGVGLMFVIAWLFGQSVSLTGKLVTTCFAEQFEANGVVVDDTITGLSGLLVATVILIIFVIYKMIKTTINQFAKWQDEAKEAEISFATKMLQVAKKAAILVGEIILLIVCAIVGMIILIIVIFVGLEYLFPGLIESLK